MSLISDGEYGPLDDDDFSMNAFSETAVRHAFLKKVYGILCVQLSVTIAFICFFLYVPAVQQFSAANPALWYVAIAGTFVCIIVLACCNDFRRKTPWNLIMLMVFTLFESWLLGAVASCYKADAVMWAAVITAVIVLGLTIFAMQTKYDFTMCGGGLLVLLLVLFCFGLLCAIIRSQWANIAYACLGALVFGMYLVFDTQIMLGGKHQYSISPEEYIFAALNLYLDIVNLFLFILSLVGRSR
ncbi:unnamed protein product [Owenia fusiformis]|uniref:Uncharacterized protein n=1 Tax=Owenia fusiformis TaxID=6347 RepID=A0A8S4N0Q5_OWEFU|nr:unnamed protein product [Owenia fusiformis]